MEVLEKRSHFTELIRLKSIEGYADQQTNVASGACSIKEKWLVNAELFRFLELNGTRSEYLSIEGGVFLVDILLAQYILIDKLVSDRINYTSLTELNVSLREISKIYNPLLNWNDSGIVIAYLQQMGIAKWRDFVSDADLKWNNFNALEKAMSLIDLEVEEIFDFLIKLQSTDAFAGGVHKVSSTLSTKLLSEPKLAAEFEVQLHFIISDEKVRKFLSAVLTGLCGKTEAQFERILEAVKDKYEGEILFQLFLGFIKCCPSACRVGLEDLMKAKFNSSSLSKQQYLRLSGQFKTLSQEIATLVTEPIEDDDFVGVYEYLYDFASTESEQNWYKDAALSIYTRIDRDQIGQLDFLLYILSEYNLDLVYVLLSARFEKMGASLFLGKHLDHIIDLNHRLFQLILTKWFNSTNSNVHSALLRVCTGRNSEGICRVSDEYFRSLPIEDKVYIAFKIAGYIYSMEHLQSLLFSVLEASNPNDEMLLVNLEHIFKDYLVYNYRSTLDVIKEKLADNDYQTHFKKFLTPIQDAFQQYFAELNKVRVFSELQSDSKLEELLRFYKQQLFAESMKENNQIGFLSMFKSVNIHAKKWAIRRPGEMTHKVEPLGLIQHSLEFPSGEKLDPTYQESLRRNYKRIQKNEINLS